VVIYFRKVTIQRLVESFHSILADQGYLFLGYSETLYKFRHRFESLFWRDTFFYQKRSEEEPAEEETLPPEGEAPVVEETPSPLPLPAEDVDPYALLAAGDAAGAERAFASASDGGRQSLVGRAYACVRDGRPEEARDLLVEIQKDGDLHPEGYYISGLIHQARGDRPMARQEYERALFLDPGFYPAQIQIAEILAAEQRMEEAIRGFRAALESLPSPEIPYLVTLEGVFPHKRIPEILEGAIQEMEEMRS
jgi:tetratricopeptide (TPR) repeat protein